MPFISLRDIQVYYEISGKGPRLLYISGTGADWQQQNPERYQAILARNNARNAGVDEPGRETGARRLLEARIDHDTFGGWVMFFSDSCYAGGLYA